MRMHLLAVLLAGHLLAADAPLDTEKLQGSWEVVKAERNGQPADDVEGHRLTFAGKSFRIAAPDGKLLYEGTWTIDGKGKPAAIDFTHTAGMAAGKTWRGILQLEGTTLKICDNAPDPSRPRPAALATSAGSGHVLVTLERRSK